MKLHLLQNKFRRTINNFSRQTSILELHKAFNTPHFYDYVNKLYWQEGEVMQNQENVRVNDIENVRSFNFVAVKRTTVQVTRLPL
jgi:hypothetical protein